MDLLMEHSYMCHGLYMPRNFQETQIEFPWEVGELDAMY